MRAISSASSYHLRPHCTRRTASAITWSRAASEGGLRAPLPGTVTAIHTAPGAAVARGAVLVVLEAMKTVFRLTAPADLVVASLGCRVGEAVAEGQVLVGFADAEAAGPA